MPVKLRDGRVAADPRDDWIILRVLELEEELRYELGQVRELADQVGDIHARDYARNRLLQLRGTGP